MDQSFKPAGNPTDRPAGKLTRVSQRAEYWEGFRRGIPVMIASAPFGLLFGAVAIDNGFTIGEALFMSATVYAGASQMVGIDLFGHKIAPWVIVLSIFAVNFRHVLYSASLGRRIGHFTFWQKALSFFVLVDPQYAESEQRAEAGRRVSFAWYIGLATPVYVMWSVETLLGAVFGNLITDPQAVGLDFVLPIYFLGLVMSFRERKNWLPVVIASSIASIIAFHWVGSPWHVTLGALGGILVAVILAKPEEGRV